MLQRLLILTLLVLLLCDAIVAQASSRNLKPQEVAELTAQSEAGNATAQTRLGIHFINRNDKQTQQEDALSAAKWFRLAADQGNAEAQFYLSGMYKDGIGVREDYVEAYFWSQLAVKNGNCPSCRPDRLLIYTARLSEIEHHVTDVQKKSVASRVQEWTPTPSDVQFLELKAANGDVDAQYQVGLIYAEGKLVSKNRGKAYMCMLKAAEQGRTKAKEALPGLEPSPEQRAKPWSRILGVPVRPHSPAPHPCDYPF